MSSADEDGPSAKKRKLQRACDYCRRRKIKCDGPERSDNRCSRCEAYCIACTYNNPHPSNPNNYVKKIEGRLERVEQLLNKLCPDFDIASELDGPVSDRELTARTLDSGGSRASSSRNDVLSPLSSLPMTPHVHTSPDEPDRSDNDEDLDQGLIESLQKLSVSPQPYRYHGKSSGLVLIRTAVELKNQQLGHFGHVEPQERIPHQYPWLAPASQESVPLFDNFPPTDLMDSLVDLYFRRINDILPLLHEPTFKEDIRRRLHLSQGGFGAVVLLVCASAARLSSDARVLQDGTDDWRSAGWKWFQAVEDWRKVTASLAPAQLHDLQICVLMGDFLQGSAAPQANWNLIGSGLRMAVDVGAHRKKMYNAKFTIEDELWRRAFWILVLNEWLTSYGVGRPIFMHDEDIDVALPTEIDDEYWTTSASDGIPRQPEGKPSKVAFLVAGIRLTRILARAMQTLYSLNRSKPHGEEQRTVTELDSSLNNWLDSLPAHLRWNPDQPDTLFLTQSATLYAHYYLTQFAVHRPFMSASRRQLSLSLPSAIICTNAARSSLQVLDMLHKRTGSPYHKNMGPIFMSGAILFMHVWGQKRAGRLENVKKDVEILRRAVVMMDVIKTAMQVSEIIRNSLEQLLLAVTTPPPDRQATMSQDSTIPAARSAGNGRSSLYVSAPAVVSQSPIQSFELDGTRMGNPLGPSFPSIEKSQFDDSGVDGRSALGLGALGFVESGSIFPSTSGSGFDQYWSEQVFTADATSNEGLGDESMAAVAYMDDTLSMWTNAPATSGFGWDEWNAYLSSANDSTNPGPGR